MAKVAYALLCIWLAPAGASGQSLAQRVSAVGTGTVHLSFLARPGICGDGRQNISMAVSNDEWEGNCEQQTARVSLVVENRRTVEVRAYVGGRWRSGSSSRDLGTVRP